MHDEASLHLLSTVGKLLKSTQTPQAEHSCIINNIQYTISLVTKPKLTYI
jgi:hypothetical protein